MSTSPSKEARDPDAERLRYATDPREGDCLTLLPSVNPRRALFLGNALAIVPFLLSERFESVVVADASARRMALARERQKQEGVDNVTFISSQDVDDNADRSGGFDLVVFGDDRPDDAVSTPFDDARTPSRLSSLVAGGGCLMYGVRVRMWPALARTLMRRTRLDGLALYPSHARLLSAATFTTVRGYWRRPRRRPYQMYLPLDSDAVIAYWIRNYLRGPSIRARCTAALALVANRLGRFAYLVDDFLVIAQRS